MPSHKKNKTNDVLTLLDRVLVESVHLSIIPSNSWRKAFTRTRSSMVMYSCMSNNSTSLWVKINYVQFNIWLRENWKEHSFEKKIKLVNIYFEKCP